MLSVADLADVPGTVSVWFGRPGNPAPAYARLADVPHDAASTVKLAILVALYRAHEAGRLDLDDEVPVHNDFPSAVGGRFSLRPGRSVVWQRVGGRAPLRWLAEEMIVASNNLASNLVLDTVGLDAVARVWPLVGAERSALRRHIEDRAARAAGICNEVTAADLAALLGGIATATVAGPASCAAMIDTLCRQRHQEDLAAGLPPGTRVAHKNGWITGIRHAAGLVYPPDAPPYTLVVCLSTPLAQPPPLAEPDAACRLVARIAAESWDQRHSLQ